MSGCWVYLFNHVMKNTKVMTMIEKMRETYILVWNLFLVFHSNSSQLQKINWFNYKSWIILRGKTMKPRGSGLDFQIYTIGWFQSTENEENYHNNHLKLNCMSNISHVYYICNHKTIQDMLYIFYYKKIS